jgi:hypothetical protein
MYIYVPANRIINDQKKYRKKNFKESKSIDDTMILPHDFVTTVSCFVTTLLLKDLFSTLASLLKVGLACKHPYLIAIVLNSNFSNNNNRMQVCERKFLYFFDTLLAIKAQVLFTYITLTGFYSTF